MLPWLYLHFPCLQLDDIRQQLAQQPKDDECPLIIVDTRQNTVCQLNGAAAAQGIFRGMGLASAVSLSAESAVVAYKPALEQARLHELAQWLYQVVADIALFEPDGLVLKTRGMMSLYGSFDNYWAQIEQVLTVQQVSCCPALALTPMSARLLARAGSGSLQQDTQVLQQQLDELPLDMLELPQRQLEQLKRIGVHDLKQLRRLGNKSLGRRFGLELLQYLGYIDGSRHLPLSEFRPPEHYVKYLELFHEITQSQVLLFPLKRMLSDMETFLQKREWLINLLTIILHHRDIDHHGDKHIEIGSAGGEYRADSWVTLVALKLERIELTAPVVGITLKTGAAIDRHCVTGELFGGDNEAMTPTQLVSQLQAKVGAERIVGIELFADHRPEFASGYTPALSAIEPVSSVHLPDTRPLVLLPVPVVLNEHYTLLHGPERIRAGWWSRTPIYRDYFIARNRHGALCWLYNEPNGHWFLQGYFC